MTYLPQQNMDRSIELAKNILSILEKEEVIVAEDALAIAKRFLPFSPVMNRAATAPKTQESSPAT